MQFLAVTYTPEVTAAAAVVVPDGGDFNDDLVALDPHARGARRAHLFRPSGPVRE